MPDEEESVVSDNNTDSIDPAGSDPVEPDADLDRTSHIPTDAPPESVPPVVPPRPPLLRAESAPADSVPTEAVDPMGETDAASAGRRRLSPLAIGLIVASVVAVAGWIAFGVTFAALGSAHDELSATAEKLDKVESDLNDAEFSLITVTAERDEYADAAADVTARESAVAAKEAELETREAEVKAAEDYVRETTLVDGYTYTVGLTIEPGRYRTNSTSDDCYWEITRSGTNYDDIVDNDFGTMGAVTVTVTKGQDFTSQDCGDWKKVG